jgi:arylsulfatase A-like enzyme
MGLSLKTVNKVLIAFACCIAMVINSPVAYTQQIAGNKMNIVFLLADDLRWNSLGCMGNPVVLTPNIDKLSDEGVRFNNACVTTSVCMVSRATILTGQYMRRHHVTNFGVQLSEQAMADTYPSILRKAGYWTGYVGKYGVGKIKDDQFDYSVEYEGKHWLPDEPGDSVHVTAKNEKDALNFLANRPKDKPFLLSVGFFAAHAEDLHPDQYRYQPSSEKYYQDVTIPVPKTATESALKALPPFIGSDENEGRARWYKRFDTPEKYQTYMKAYYRMVTEVDLAIGNIITELKAQGVYENTLIIVMGDNGYFQSEHQLADKWYPYEESIRIPLIVYDPRLPEAKRNTSNSEFVLNIDVAPTIISAAGEPIPSAIQGSDFSTLYLDKKAPAWRQDFYYEHPTIFKSSFIPSSEALVTHTQKYIIWPEYQYEEYFNLKKDPYEEHNKISSKKDKKIIQSMKKRFAKLKEDAK